MVAAGAFHRYAVTGVPSSAVAGAAFTVTVQALDAWGNLIDTDRWAGVRVDGVTDGSWSPTSTGNFVGAVQLSLTVTRAVPAGQ